MPDLKQRLKKTDQKLWNKPDLNSKQKTRLDFKTKSEPEEKTRLEENAREEEANLKENSKEKARVEIKVKADLVESTSIAEQNKNYTSGQTRHLGTLFEVG